MAVCRLRDEETHGRDRVIDGYGGRLRDEQLVDLCVRGR